MSKFLFLIMSVALHVSAAAAQPTPKPAQGGRDLTQIRSSGVLRALMTATPESNALPRTLSPRDQDTARLTDFAERLGLQLEIIYVESFEEIFHALSDGWGDIIADNITATEERRKMFAFSKPIDTVSDIVVAKSDNDAVKSARDLAGRSITIERGTSYWTSGAELKKQVPSLKLVKAPAGVDTEELLGKVATGAVELAIADSNYVDTFLTYCPDVKPVHVFPKPQRTAWALRKSSTELLKAVDEFLSLDRPPFCDVKGDLPSIKKRKILRVLTRNNFYCYHLAKDETRGFEHDLAVEFARRQGVKAVMIVPPKWSDMIPWLIEGKGDVIAAQTTITAERSALPGIAFCRPYCEVRETIVARARDKGLKSIPDLTGRTFVVRRNSSYWSTLKRLRDSGVGIKLLAAPQDMEAAEIVANVANGKFDLTLLDSPIAAAELSLRGDVAAAFTLDEPRRYAWITRSEDKLLRAAVNEFFEKEFKGVFYNLTYWKYFGGAKSIRKSRVDSASETPGQISIYDDLIKKHAEAQQLDWLLVAAQIKQESGFDPNATNEFACHGLLQITSHVAAEMKCQDIMSPSENLRAGTAYMRKLMDRFAPAVLDGDRVCLALASYNAGYAHVSDAQTLASKIKLDPLKWFGNVERALDLLSKPEYASKAKYGYCRSSETLPYVRDIFFRYQDYSKLNKAVENKK